MKRAVFGALVGLSSSLIAQRQPGHPIGRVTAAGNLIHLELDSGAISPERLFDLDHRTLRFTPDGPGYRVETAPLAWDADFGPPLTAGTTTLENFSFPFSGKTWDTLNVAIGAITFGARPAANGGRGGGGVPAGNRTGAGMSARAGFPMERYPMLQTVGRSFINVIPGIAAFVKPNLTGQRYLKELADRAVITWTLTEPSAGIQAFTWTPTVNRIQAVLHKDGAIEISYNDVSARDAVVGVFPMVTAGVERQLAAVTSEPAGPAIKRVTFSAIDDLFLEVTIETVAPVPPEGDSRMNGVTYRIAFDPRERGNADPATSPVVWTIRGAPGGRGGVRGPAASRYVVSGAGAEQNVTVSGNAISVRGILPIELAGEKQLTVRTDVSTGTPSSVVDFVAVRSDKFGTLHSPEMDLSAATKHDGPFRVAYEGFHWPEIPRAQDVACSVISALGDKFDFLATYSDFRVDNPEGGTPSTGPRGGNVSGIGSSTNGLENYCSAGQLQWMYVE
ncbi:MAG: hypothetical protein ACREPM_22880, partial [Gemmatimonadaceae bacterium]